ncbi:MAG TPA: bifunctional pyr operon transcriptional regulator/uracil phosphoribosyltransferase PyrR [Burkholderiales bacterium]|nr:bifunctional pyr operon transcriptional regulator/uracil phosphoribosyltransferase PyrR [Burkholderiales bacterium]
MKLPDPEALLDTLAAKIRVDLRPETALVGIHTGGVWVAQRLHRMLGVRLPMGTIDVAFYRDDYKKKGLTTGVRPSDIPFPVEDAEIILVDDVLYTGRTIRAAMNEIFDYGRPNSIRLAALVDRGERQLPICPQYVAAEIAATRDQTIELKRDEAGRLALALVSRSA